MKLFIAALMVTIWAGCATHTTPVQEVPPGVTVPEAPAAIPATPTPKADLGEITSIAAGSQCAKYFWKDRGTAPKAYMKGMALTFAKAVCQIDSPANKIVSAARKTPESQYDTSDVLSWYNSNFKSLGMNNDVAGVDTLRHVYTLLIGLGMRESSGKYCCGRDMSADFSTADSAEAGIFQSSWGASRKSVEMKNLLTKYQASDKGCFSEVYKEGVSCKASDAKNWGTGTGVEFQALSKSCPSFSTEYAAILVRLSGGTKGEYGPLRKKAAEIRPECNDMLAQVQKLVQENSEFCKQL